MIGDCWHWLIDTSHHSATVMMPAMLKSTCVMFVDVACAVLQVFGDGVVRTGSNLALLNPLSAVWRRILAAR